MQTINFLDQDSHLTRFNTKPYKTNKNLNLGDALLTFRIGNCFTDDENICTMNLQFLLEHYSRPDKLSSLGLVTVVRFSDPDREFEKSLESLRSLGMLSSVYKTSGEYLIEAYKKISVLEYMLMEEPHTEEISIEPYEKLSGLEPIFLGEPYTGEIFWDVAIENTKRIMQHRKNLN